VHSSKGDRYRKSAKIDALKPSSIPLVQVQFGADAFPEFSQSLPLTTAFRERVRNAKRQRRSAWWECKEQILKMHPGPLARPWLVRSERGGGLVKREKWKLRGWEMISEWWLISVHRIVQIFRERNMNISTLHFDAAIRRFIEDGEGAG
jgi:hypothetical protein